jgi:hypothetical protein
MLFLLLLWELCSNLTSEKAKGGCDQFPAHFNRPMHWRHWVSVGSLAGYIGEAMGGPPICHASYAMVGKSFGIPAIYNFTRCTKTSKREDDLIKMPDARRQFLSPKNVKIPAFSLPEKIFSLVKQFQRVVRQMHILILLSRCHHGRKCYSRECILCGWEHHEKEG